MLLNFHTVVEKKKKTQHNVYETRALDLYSGERIKDLEVQVCKVLKTQWA